LHAELRERDILTLATHALTLGCLMAYDETAAARVRKVLSGRRSLVERKMMGGICFMLGGNTCCGVCGSALLVRVGKDAYPKMLALDHVRPLEFGGRRPTGFVLVDADGYRTEAALKGWVQRGIDFAATLPAKGPVRGKERSGTDRK